MSVTDELKADTGILIARMILREYDRETASILTSVDPERHRAAAGALRVALAFACGAFTLWDDAPGVGENWLPSLRAFIEAHTDAAA